MIAWDKRYVFILLVREFYYISIKVYNRNLENFEYIYFIINTKLKPI